jgi:hypothetical protein
MTQEIIAIDPGPIRSALVLWDGRRVKLSRWEDNEDIREILRSNRDGNRRPVYIEMVACYGMAVGASVFDTCVEIGRMIEIVGGGACRIYRRDVKLHICGSARAKDANVRQALLDAYGPVGTKKNPGPLYGCKSHVWAALAVAVTAYATMPGARDADRRTFLPEESYP